MERGKPFYQQVFGWGDRITPIGKGQPPYTEWQLGGKGIGHGMEMPPQVPAEVPPHWLVYFATHDVEAALNEAIRLGAEPVVPAVDYLGGRLAILRDPQGAISTRAGRRFAGDKGPA